MSTVELESIANALQALVTVMALMAAGLWTYLLFIRNRQSYPKAGLQQISMRRSIDQDTSWVRVSVLIENSGQVLLRLSSITVWIQQIAPWPTDLLKDIRAGEDPIGPNVAENSWPLLGEKEIEWQKGEKQLEPNESESIHFDFFIPAEAEELMIYTYLGNSTRQSKRIGWSVTSIIGGQGLPSSSGPAGTIRLSDGRPGLVGQ